MVDNDKLEELGRKLYSLIVKSSENREDTNIIESIVEELEALNERHPGLYEQVIHTGDGPHMPIYLPLHLAVRTRAPARVLSLLLSYYPAALLVRSGSDDTTLLHEALIYGCFKGNDEDVLQVLITPESASAWDGQGELPLHCFCRGASYGCPLELRIVEMLVNTYPDSVAKGWGNRDDALLRCILSATIFRIMMQLSFNLWLKCLLLQSWQRTIMVGCHWGNWCNDLLNPHAFSLSYFKSFSTFYRDSQRVLK